MLTRTANVVPTLQINLFRDVREVATDEHGLNRTITYLCHQFNPWDRKKSEGRGRGIACGFEKGSYIATAAEISTDPKTGRVKLERVVTSFECGAIVNRVHLHNQVEGAVVQAIGGALFESIQFKNGQILNGKFANYRLPRFSDMPVIEIVLLDRKDLPSAGAGETPIVGLAPAVGNAMFDLVGKRVRSMPLAP